MVITNFIQKDKIVALNVDRLFAFPPTAVSILEACFSVLHAEPFGAIGALEERRVAS